MILRVFNFRITFFVLILVLGLNSAYGQMAFSDQDLKIYEQTLAQCQAVPAGSWNKIKSIYANSTQREAFKDALFQAGKAGFFDEMALGNYILNKGISKYTYETLNSDGFISALLVCYPKSEEDRNHFVISLLFHEWAGKSTAVVFHYLTTYKLLAFGMKKVSGILMSKVPRFGTAAVWMIRGLAVYSAINMLRKIYGNPTAEQEKEFSSIIQNVDKKPQESLQETLVLLDQGLEKIDSRLASESLNEEELKNLNNKRLAIIKHKNILLKYKVSAANV
jgi:hypothetical protein